MKQLCENAWTGVRTVRCRREARDCAGYAGIGRFGRSKSQESLQAHRELRAPFPAIARYGNIFQVAGCSFFNNAAFRESLCISSVAGPLSFRSSRHRASSKPAPALERFVGLVPGADLPDTNKSACTFPEYQCNSRTLPWLALG